MVERILPTRSIALLAAALACACADDAQPRANPLPAADTAPDTMAPAPAGPSDGDIAGHAGDWRVPPLGGEGESNGIAVLRDVRTARHEHFDRIVFDFGPDAVPAYEIRDVEGSATQCGSGHPIDPRGEHGLQIGFRSAAAHTEAGEATVSERDRQPGLQGLRSLRLICDFEGHVDWVAGLALRPRLRTLVLREPGRLVLDIAHDTASQLQQLP